MATQQRNNNRLEQMNDLRSYSRHWVKEFIEIYKGEICLWQANHPDYTNHALRSKAYNKLIDKLKEVEQRPDRSTVLRKINSLRSAFRRELRKKRLYKGYEPRLWYFDLISFVADQKYPSTRKCFSKAENESVIEVFEEEGMPQEEEEQVLDVITVKSSEIQQNVPQRVPAVVTESPQESKKFLNEVATESVEKDCGVKMMTTYYKPQECIPVNSIVRHDDEFDATGMYIASKLRVMQPTQRIIAEKLISDILFSGQLKGLSVKSKLET